MYSTVGQVITTKEKTTMPEQMFLPLKAIALCIAFPLSAFANNTDESETLTGDVARGDAAYAADCAECHAAPARIMRRVPGDDDAGRAAWLEDFLPEHFAPDPQVRADIIAYMLDL